MMRLCQRLHLWKIIRRYYKALGKMALGENVENEVYKIELLMKQAKITDG